MKKLLSVVLAVLVASLFIFPTCVFAAGDPTIEVSSVSVEAGDSFDVEIVLKDNPGITSMKLNVEFDNGALTLNKASFGEKFADNGLTSKSLQSPVTLNWFKPSKKGDPNVTGDDVFATLSFTALKAADAKENITVSYKEADVYNTDENNVTFKVVGGEITVGGADGADVSSAVGTVGVSDDKGDYTGPELDPETGEETGENPGDSERIKTESTDDTKDEKKSESTDTEENKAPVIWIFAVIAAVLLIAAVVLVIVKKRVTKEPLE